MRIGNTVFRSAYTQAALNTANLSYNDWSLNSYAYKRPLTTSQSEEDASALSIKTIPRSCWTTAGAPSSPEMCRKYLDEIPGAPSWTTLLGSWIRVSPTQQKPIANGSAARDEHAYGSACMTVRTLKKPKFKDWRNLRKWASGIKRTYNTNNEPVYAPGTLSMRTLWVGRVDK